MDATTLYAAAGMLCALVIGFLLFQPTELVRWIQKKNYQYEVTFALYMLTPTEKFIFNSILFLTLSMLLIASFLYLPDHIATMARRAYYYFAGGDDLTTSSASALLNDPAALATSTSAFLLSGSGGAGNSSSSSASSAVAAAVAVAATRASEVLGEAAGAVGAGAGALGWV